VNETVSEIRRIGELIMKIPCCINGFLFSLGMLEFLDMVSLDQSNELCSLIIMCANYKVDFDFRRPHNQLPTETDFDPFGGDLDAQSAWRNFGGRTLSEAFEIFLSNPLHYQENFMFMGCRAFGYYFPVIAKYLREIRYADDWDDCQAAILGHGVKLQFGWNGTVLPEQLLKEIESLSEVVQTRLAEYAVSEDEQKRIEAVWKEVDQELTQYRKRRDVASNA
jgi:hypothetical protein